MQRLKNHERILSSLRCSTASWRILGVPAVLLAALMSVAAVTATSADEARLSVPVRILGAPQPAPSMDPMIPAREPAPEATPAARMPQYQLHLKDNGDAGDPNSPQLRFVLSTPGTPLLIEASIFIDGQPFRQARENRVQEIMRYIADPVAFKAEEDRILAEAQAEAAAKNAPGLLESIVMLTRNALAEEPAATEPEVTEPEVTEPEVTEPEVTEPEVTPGSPVEEVVEPETETPGASETTVGETPAPESPVTETPAEPAIPAVPKYFAPATIYERIDRYTQSTGASPTVDEVRWLLTNWVDGPLLLFLNDNFQRFRADQQPVFRVLDRDRDGRLSAEEIAQSVASFQECDLNRDGIVEATELAQAAKDVRDQPAVNSSGKLIFRLPDEASAANFLRRLEVRYSATDEKSPSLPRFDIDGDHALNAEELKQLYERPADIRMTIELSTVQPESSRLTIDGFSEEFATLKDSAGLNRSSLTLRFPTFNLEFLAAQGSISDQISIGAVNDGYAMLQEIDPNTDGRFSVRELRELNSRLAAFDRNSDGQITSDETHPTFRVCIGLGATAHQPLGLLREVNTADSATPVAGPEWFTEMDKNRDFDLTRQEFPGTDEQFKQLDADSDELISAVEANKL